MQRRLLKNVKSPQFSLFAVISCLFLICSSLSADQWPTGLPPSVNHIGRGWYWLNHGEYESAKSEFLYCINNIGIAEGSRYYNTKSFNQVRSALKGLELVGMLTNQIFIANDYYLKLLKLYPKDKLLRKSYFQYRNSVQNYFELKRKQ